MKRVAQIISVLALGGALVPALLFFYDVLELSQAKALMLVSAGVWFTAAPLGDSLRKHRTSEKGVPLDE